MAESEVEGEAATGSVESTPLTTRDTEHWSQAQLSGYERSRPPTSGPLPTRFWRLRQTRASFKA